MFTELAIRENKLPFNVDDGTQICYMRWLQNYAHALERVKSKKGDILFLKTTW